MRLFKSNKSTNKPVIQSTDESINLVKHRRDLDKYFKNQLVGQSINVVKHSLDQKQSINQSTNKPVTIQSENLIARRLLYLIIHQSINQYKLSQSTNQVN